MRPRLIDWRPLFVAISLLSVSHSGAADENKKRLPDRARVILNQAEQLELFSLDPDAKKDKSKNGFHDWAVLGKTVIKKDESRKELLSSLDDAIGESDESGAMCFHPRHSIRARVGKETVDLVICFECKWVYVYFNGSKTKSVSRVIDDKLQPAFDTILKENNVPLPRAAKD